MTLIEQAVADMITATKDYTKAELSKAWDAMLAVMEERFAELPTPEPGTPGEKGEPGPKGDPGDTIKGDKGDPGLPGHDAQDGRDGRDGAPGRDALELAVLNSIDETKVYPRGTYARHAGGLWRASHDTDGMAGWESIVDGVKAIEIEQGDDLRTFTLRSVLSSGSVYKQSFVIPMIIYRKVYKIDTDYERGDTVTWGGSLWHCNEPTTDKPGEDSKSWTLAAKHGRDGKDGKDGVGERGLPGKDAKPW